MRARKGRHAQRHVLFVTLLATVALVSIGQERSLAAVDRGPTPFHLIFEGAHDQSYGQANPLRRGGFSAVAPVCAAGAGVDERYVHPDGVVREHTCADGSGSFTAILSPAVAELGGAGEWRIVGGTGRYADLRGQGAFAGEFVSGSPSREETVSFRTTWTGLVGFDASAPVLGQLRLSVARRAGDGPYVLRVSFRASDDSPDSRIRYVVLPSSGSRALPFAQGRARSGRTSLALRFGAVYRTDLPIVVEIRVSDALGNERRVVRSVRFKHR